MKINYITLRFTLIVIILRFIIGVAAGLVLAKYLYPIELGINVQMAISIFLMLVELYLYYYFLIFLNQILSFKKVNIFLWILIIASALQIVFSQILKAEVKAKEWTIPVMAVLGLSYAIARIGLIIRIFYYRGVYRKYLILYAISGVIPIIFQMVVVPVTVIFKPSDVTYLPYVIQFLFFLPCIPLSFLFYNALTHSNLHLEKGTYSALDDGEFSN